jgi:hypothetical protein
MYIKWMSELIKNIEDLKNFKKTGDQALEHIKDKASKEIRYSFLGKLFPLQIENFLKCVFKNSIYDRTTESFKDAEYGHEYIISNISINDANGLESYDILYLHNNKTDTIRIYQTLDSQRGEYPIRECEYQDNIYREIPYNGNVYSHTKNQQKHIDKYTDIDYSAGIINNSSREIINSFHPRHDLGEIFGRDINDTIKTLQDYEEEQVPFIKLLDTLILAKVITENDKQLALELCNKTDGSNNLFKVYERLTYISDAIKIYNTSKYYNQKQFAAGDILGSQLPYFTNPKYHITIPSENNKATTTSNYTPQHFESVRIFLKENKEHIEEIIEWLEKNQNNIPNQIANCTPEIIRKMEQNTQTAINLRPQVKKKI